MTRIQFASSFYAGGPDLASDYGSRQSEPGGGC